MFEGDPINTATGNKFQQDTDFRGSSWLTFRRFYNSIGYVASATLGPQWRHSFDRSLSITRFDGQTSATSIDLLRPDGSREHFRTSNGVWVADADTPDALVQHDDGNGNPASYSVTIAGLRHTETYDSNGRLQSVIDSIGQGIALAYSDAATPATTAPRPNLLLTVTDLQGRQLGFSYNSQGNLSQVKQPDGGVLTYGYDASTGNLISVQYPDGKTLQYVYNEPALTGSNTPSLPHALTGVIDETGTRYETTGYSYYNEGAATSTSFAGGADATVISRGSMSATLTSPLGASINLGFKNILGALKPGSSGKFCGLQCNQATQATTYDANGYPTSTTGFKGVVTKTVYDANGLLNQQIEAFGATIQRTTNTTWDVALRVPLKRMVVDASGSTVAMSAWGYNSAGQTLARCEIDPAVANAGSYNCSSSSTPPNGIRRWASTYCTAVDATQCPLVGLLLSTDEPRTDVSDITKYAYYLQSRLGSPVLQSSVQVCNLSGQGRRCFRFGYLGSGFKTGAKARENN